MADDSTSTKTAKPSIGLAPDDSIMRTAVVGTCFILWVLAVFTIVSANQIKADIGAVRSSVEALMSTSAGANVSGMTMVDKDGAVVYTLKRPDPPAEGMDGICSTDGCSDGGQCSAAGAASDTGKTVDAAK